MKKGNQERRLFIAFLPIQYAYEFRNALPSTGNHLLWSCTYFTTKYLVRRFWLKGSDIINDMFDTISQFVWATQEINHLGFEG